MSSITKPQHTDAYRLATLRTGLRLELKGMRVNKGKTCYAILKTLGFHGSEETVLQQVIDELEDAEQELLKKIEYIKANP